ncbi:SpoIID/LytB domain-containing protein [Chlamydiales bacterium]|nr:SpoIID/LytB domain-containing protein [Chlamydiales bacterium]
MIVCKVLVYLSVFLMVTHQNVDAGIWDRIVNVFVGEEESDPPVVRALIVQDATSAIVEVRGGYNVYDPYKNGKVTSSFSSKKNFIESKSFGLKWGEEFPGVFQLKIVPDDQQTSTLVNGIEYKGNMYIYEVGDSLSIINEVEIEDYVTSVLSPLFDQPLSKEAMNALAIAARTDAYHHVASNQNPYWDVDALKTGYQGHAVTKRGNGVDKAVSDTRYMVMNLSTAYQGDKITTFPAVITSKALPNQKSKTTAISIDEVDKLARRGAPADRILSKLFPNTTISLIHSFGTPCKQEIAELYN